MKTCLPLASALLLAGCAMTPGGSGVSPLSAEQSAALRAGTFATLEAWRAQYPDAGFIENPTIRLSVISACGLGSTLTTVVNPTAPEMSERLALWCRDIMAATTRAGADAVAPPAAVAAPAGG